MRHHLWNVPLVIIPYKTQDPNPETPEHNPTNEPNPIPTHIPYPKPTPNLHLDDIHTDVLHNTLVGNEENLTDNETETDFNMNDSEIDELETLAYNNTNRTTTQGDKQNNTVPMNKNNLNPNIPTPTDTIIHGTNNSDFDFVQIPPHLLTSNQAPRAYTN